MWIPKVFRVEKKIEDPSDKRLELIREILFPPLKLEEELGQDGVLFKFHVDSSIDTNLDAALIDLQEGNNDSVVHKTITKMISRLIEVRKILDSYPEINEEAKYIIVDDGKDKEDIII